MVNRKISLLHWKGNRRYDDSGAIIPNYSDFLRLTPNRSGFDENYFQYFKSITETFCQLLSDSDLLFNVSHDDIIEALMRIQSNSFHFPRKQIWGCFPTFSYLNHSCRPNCIIYDDDNSESFLHSLQPINLGDELTIDYGLRYQKPSFKTLEQTCRAWTKENYMFECSCPKKD